MSSSSATTDRNSPERFTPSDGPREQELKIEQSRFTCIDLAAELQVFNAECAKLTDMSQQIEPLCDPNIIKDLRRGLSALEARIDNMSGDLMRRASLPEAPSPESLGIPLAPSPPDLRRFDPVHTAMKLIRVADYNIRASRVNRAAQRACISRSGLSWHHRLEALDSFKTGERIEDFPANSLGLLGSGLDERRLDELLAHLNIETEGDRQYKLKVFKAAIGMWH